MKRSYLKMTALGLLFLSTINVFAQETSSFTITPELTASIVKNYSYKVYVYHVTRKEVDYKVWDTGQVPTKDYKYALDKLKKYQSASDEYNAKLGDVNKEFEEYNTIISNIDSFLKSDEKYDTKKQFLIDAQNIADKYSINITTNIPSTGLLSVASQQSNWATQPTRELLIYNPNKRPNKDDLKICQDYMSTKQKNLRRPNYPPHYEEYLDAYKQTQTMKKTESGRVATDKVAKRLAYIVEQNPIDVESLSGQFIKLPNSYVVTESDIEDKFVKNEVTSDLKGCDKRLFTDTDPLLQKVGTEDYYYILSFDYVKAIIKNNQIAELSNTVTKLGYKIYGDGEYSNPYYINTKTCQVYLDDVLFDYLKHDPSCLTKIDIENAKDMALAKRTIPMSKVLDKYYGLYRIQHNKMSKTDINAWRQATANAQKLNDEIVKFNDSRTLNFGTPLDKSHYSLYEDFSTYLGGSKSILGM